MDSTVRLPEVGALWTCVNIGFKYENDCVVVYFIFWARSEFNIFKHIVIDNGKKSQAIDRTIKNLINFKVRWVFIKKVDSRAIKSFLKAQAYIIGSKEDLS